MRPFSHSFCRRCRCRGGSRSGLGIVCPVASGQREGKRAAVTLLALDPYRAAVKLDELPSQRQTEPGSLSLFRIIAADLYELFEDGRLIGQLSRRDVLRAVEELGVKRLPRKHYPDYGEPAIDVGARRT